MSIQELGRIKEETDCQNIGERIQKYVDYLYSYYAERLVVFAGMSEDEWNAISSLVACGEVQRLVDIQKDARKATEIGEKHGALLSQGVKGAILEMDMHTREQEQPVQA